MKNVSFNNVKIEDNLFNNRIEVLSTTSILEAIKKCYDTPRVQNFIEAHKAISGEDAVFSGIVYDDADIYKILEGAAYILHQQDNVELKIEMEKLIDIIIDAQEPSGYITTKHTIHPEMKWICLDAHEMYNMGHLIEATIAHYQYSGSDKFLNVGIKVADYLYEKFGKTQTNWVPGHQEIELALLKLYRVTNNEKYIKLCGILLDSRGRANGWANNTYQDKAVFIPNQEIEWNCAYHQDSLPLDKIEKVEGHAVRAMYMYTAMANISEYNDKKYIPALEKVWENLVYKNMYITGGIGSTKVNEGFTYDYDLPNHSAYCETCASVGMVLWNSRMFEITHEVKYLDVIERELKNGILSGLSLDGKKYFYDNPLESKSDKSRSEWFETSCCPTQLMRFIPQIGNYIYYCSENKLIIAQPIESEISTQKYQVKFEVNDKRIKISNKGSQSINVAIRIPLNTVLADGEKYQINNGFVECEIADFMEFEIISNVEKIMSNQKVKENIGKSSFMYKGFVYCAEEIDNVKSNLQIPNDYILEISSFNLKGCMSEKISLTSYDNVKLTLIPYFMWNNRGDSVMKVWLDDTQEKLY